MGGWPRRLSMGWEPQRHLSAQLSTTRCFRLFPHGSAAWIAPPWRPFETLILPHFLFIPGRVIYLFFFFFLDLFVCLTKIFLIMAAGGAAAAAAAAAVGLNNSVAYFSLLLFGFS